MPRPWLEFMKFALQQFFPDFELIGLKFSGLILGPKPSQHCEIGSGLAFSLENLIQ